MIYVRQGTCKQCGKCCRLRNLLTAASLKSVVRRERALIRQGIKCKHLTDDGLCNLFHVPEKRPLACWMHPNHPSAQTEGCLGYTFVAIAHERFAPEGYVPLKVHEDTVFFPKEDVDQIARIMVFNSMLEEKQRGAFVSGGTA